MNVRSIPGSLAIVAGLAAVALAGRDAPVRPDAAFAAASNPWMPAASDAAVLTGTWFCPGVPASGEAGIGGEVVVANRGADELAGRFTILTADGIGAEQSFTVGPWSRRAIDVDAFVTTDFASAIVEINGASAVVEQVAIHPDGLSVAPCSNETSAEWHLADGYTVGGSVETLILTNPYDDTAVADLTFATESTPGASPNAFQGFPIPPRSVKTIRIAELGARDEPVIAVSVSASRGRLVLGRAQQYLGGERNGYSITLAAPALRDQWWFADGEVGDGITETFSLFNPTSSSVDVDVVFLGLPISSFGYDDSIRIDPGAVVVFEPATIDEIPSGRHAVVFSTLSEPSIVVERVLTRTIEDSQLAPDDRRYTTVVLGATGRIDGYVATEWHIGVGPSTPTPDALVIYTTDNVDGTITVSAVGPAGPEAVPSLTDIPLPPGSVVQVDLVDDAVLDRELIVTSTNRIFVERLLPRGGDLAGRSGSWALPLNF